MLTNGLVQTLLDKKIIINKVTQVDATFKKIDYSSRGLTLKDTCIVDDVIKQDGTYFFKLTRMGETEQIVVQAEQITLIDGMKPEILAMSFDLKVDGEKKELGKRRGRPRKYFPYGE